jgi:hypothetical protein
MLSAGLALVGLAAASRAADDGVYVAGLLFFAFGILIVFRMIAMGRDSARDRPT